MGNFYSYLQAAILSKRSFMQRGENRSLRENTALRSLHFFGEMEIKIVILIVSRTHLKNSEEPQIEEK